MNIRLLNCRNKEIKYWIKSHTRRQWHKKFIIISLQYYKILLHSWQSYSSLHTSLLNKCECDNMKSESYAHFMLGINITQFIHSIIFDNAGPNFLTYWRWVPHQRLTKSFLSDRHVCLLINLICFFFNSNVLLSRPQNQYLLIED